MNNHATNLVQASDLSLSLLAALRPDPMEPIADWIFANRSLSSSVTALPGPMDVSHTPYMREIYEAMHPRSGVEEVIVKKPSQVAYSELILSVLSYYAVNAPCPTMAVLASDDDIKLFMQQRVEDMRSNTPAFRRVIESADEKAADNIHNIGFRGGFIRIVPARSSSRLSAMPVRLLICDEVDQYPGDVNGQGSPLELARRRQDTFGRRRKMLMGGTPTIDGASAIDTAYMSGDRRQYHVPCIHCGALQILEFARLRWSQGQPLLARYQCAHCDAMIDERHKMDMLRAGVWIAEKPEVTTRRSYWLKGLSRIAGSLGWGQIAEAWLIAGNDPAKLKSFSNLVIGETYKEEGILELRSGDLASRAENYRAQVPEGVRVLTAGVDCQASPPRFEVEIVGWGDGFESWSIGYYVIPGGIKSPQARQQLLTLLDTPLETQGGKRTRVSFTCMDSSNETNDVYEFCKAHAHRGIMAIKGAAGEHRPIWPIKATHIKGRNALLYILGVDQAKSDIYHFAAITEPGPGYMHTPNDRKQEWYDQLLAEVRTVKIANGKPVQVWKLAQHRKNEGLDCRVYAYAAAKGPALKAGIDLSRFKPKTTVDQPQQNVQDLPIVAPTLTKPTVQSAPPGPKKPTNTKPQARPNAWGTCGSWGQKRW